MQAVNFLKRRATIQLRKPYCQNLFQSQQRNFKKVLREETLSAEVKECQYAVRGAIPLRGEEINTILQSGEKHSFQFQKMTPLNIGNPQACGQGFMSFNREVLSALLLPQLLNSNGISEDAKNTVKLLNQNMASPIGAYSSNSKGDAWLRQQIADYIEKRDGPAVNANCSHIFLTNGASEAVRLALKLLIRNEKDGIMIPIPQYPLYSALVRLEGGTMIKYYLNEEKCWGIDENEIQNRIRNANDQGTNIRAIVAINPGNPTGNVLSRKDIENIIRLSYENKILIIADEVYQNNIYTQEAPFISFRKVLAEIGEPYSSSVELLSLHSVSKGLMGECGLRGGYFEAFNLDPFAMDMLYKLKSIELCANTIGQVATYLMIDPPKEGRESSQCLSKFNEEKNAISNGLKERALLLTKTFTEMTNTTSQPIQGAMYAFPRIHFSQKALKAAETKKVSPDFMYCLDMVNETGIMTVPGSGFGQRENEYHYRITNLVAPTEHMKETLIQLKKFNEEFHNKYQ